MHIAGHPIETECLTNPARGEPRPARKRPIEATDRVAQAYRLQGLYLRALPYAQYALRLYRSIEGPYDTGALPLLRTKAAILRALGNREDADVLEAEARNIRREWDRNHPISEDE